MEWEFLIKDLGEYFEEKILNKIEIYENEIIVYLADCTMAKITTKIVTPNLEYFGIKI